MSTTEIDLIPWDADSPEHIERLLEQRDQCGWNASKVEPVWRPAQKAGSSCIYWIVRSQSSNTHTSRKADFPCIRSYVQTTQATSQVC
jgi:hypothetical protein